MAATRGRRKTDICDKHNEHENCLIKYELRIAELEKKVDKLEDRDREKDRDLKNIYKDVYIKVGAGALLIGLIMGIIGFVAKDYIGQYLPKKQEQQKTKP